MRRLFVALCILLCSSSVAVAQGYGTGSNPNTHRVNPYYTPQGTYVQPHVQTNPNATRQDNYSTYPNYNPNTGATGTKRPRSY